MTVAVAIIDRKAVALGADSQWWLGAVATQGPKVVRHGDCVAASSGDGWAQEMLLDCMPDAQHDPRKLRDALLAWSRAAGHGAVTDGGWAAPWNVLFINPRGMWGIEGEGTILDHPLGYAAIGSGAPVAYGALHATKRVHKKLGIKRRVEMALEAAAAHGDGIAPPFDIVEITLL